MTTEAPEAPVTDDAAPEKEAQTDQSAKTTAPKPKKVVKKKAAPKAAAKPKKAAHKATTLTLHQASEKSLETDKPVEIGSVIVLPISAIDRYDNPRHEPETLYENGYTLFGNPKVIEAKGDDRISLVHLAMHESIEQVRRYVNLIEQFEGPIRRLVNADGKTVLVGTECACQLALKDEKSRTGWKIEQHTGAPQSIVELAKDIAVFTQLDPIEVRLGNKISVIDGGRRIAAILYLHAKAKVLHEDKESDDELFGGKTPKDYPATIQATELKVSGDDFALACRINLSRKEFSPLQEGRVFHEMLDKINPATKKPYTQKEAAQALGVEYGTFRNRQALWMPVKTDDDGKVVKGLTDNDRRKVAMGEMLVTAASRKALGEKHYSETGRPSHNRKKPLPLAEMQKRFDQTQARNEERRKAFAECMGLTFAQATKESESRIAEQDRQIAAAGEKNKNRKVRKKGKAA
jgi:hypothetical protein